MGSLDHGLGKDAKKPWKLGQKNHTNFSRKVGTGTPFGKATVLFGEDGNWKSSRWKLFTKVSPVNLLQSFHLDMFFLLYLCLFYLGTFETIQFQGDFVWVWRISTWFSTVPPQGHVFAAMKITRIFYDVCFIFWSLYLRPKIPVKKSNRIGSQIIHGCFVVFVTNSRHGGGVVSFLRICVYAYMALCHTAPWLCSERGGLKEKNSGPTTLTMTFKTHRIHGIFMYIYPYHPWCIYLHLP